MASNTASVPATAVQVSPVPVVAAAAAAVAPANATANVNAKPHNGSERMGAAHAQRQGSRASFRQVCPCFASQSLLCIPTYPQSEDPEVFDLLLLLLLWLLLLLGTLCCYPVSFVVLSTRLV